MYLLMIYVIYTTYDPVFLLVFVPGMREMEVLRVSQSICSDGSQLRQAKVIHEGLGYPSAYFLIAVDCELNTTRNHTKLLRFHCKFTHLGSDIEDALVRDNQEISI